MNTNPSMPGQPLVIPDQTELVREENNSILSRQEKIEDLIQDFSFSIDNIVFHSSSIIHTPDSERRIGGRSSSYNFGNSLTTTIKTSKHPNIQEVYFPGWPHLQKGDFVKVHFFVGEKVNLQSYRGIIPYPCGRNERTEYSGDEEIGPFVWHKARNFSGKTAALKIEKLTKTDSGYDSVAMYIDHSLMAKYGLK